MKLSHSVQVTIAFLFVCGVNAPSHAEGVFESPPNGGIFGANRRVLTAQLVGPNAGYHAVQGTFTMPSEVQVSLRRQGFLDIQNVYTNKPSFYLGSRQERSSGVNFEVDAGLQLEPIAVQATDSSGNTYTVPPGWSVFMTVSNTDFRAGTFTVSAPGQWRCGAFTSNPDVSQFRLRWVIERLPAGVAVTPPSASGVLYRGYLDVFALGAVEQPGVDPADGRAFPGSKRLYAAPGDATNQGHALLITTSGIRAKRVVCITQGPPGNPNLTFPQSPPADTAPNTYEEDGSFMRGVRFFGGEVATQTSPGFNWMPWSSAPIDQGVAGSNTATGYYPPGRDKTVPGTARHTVGSRLVVDFPRGQNPSLPVVANGETDQDYDLTSERYSEETVDINLQRYIPADNEVVVSGR